MSCEDEYLMDIVDSPREDDEEYVDEQEYLMNLEAEPIISQEPQPAEEDEFPFEVLTADQIVQHMVECIKDVNTIVQLPPPVTRVLLNHFKWDKDKLMECYYDGDQEKLFSDVHVISPFKTLPSIVNATGVLSKPSKKSTKPPASQPTSFKCEICFLPVQTSIADFTARCGTRTHSTTSEEESVEIMLTGLLCGHKFCAACWDNYLTTKIVDEGMGEMISCAAHGCDILVDDETVMKLVSSPAVRLKYQQLITNSFVECNRLLHWCTAPNCGYIVKVQYHAPKPVTCNCGHVFCFACGENWHDPVQCKWLRKWIKKCDDDSETSNWIAANTRECPKCHATIEKDGGCNHMMCKRCKFDFCWVCLGPWEPHGSSWYNCNRYDEDAAKKARDAQEKSRAALQRYLFYCNRYMNHMQSLKFEHKLYKSVRQKMEEMQQHSMSWIEVQFLKKAVDVLCQCRQTLMYTYVFAFYLKKNNQSVIFEDNQKDLENATEQLSEYLERDITTDMLVDIKQKVQDKYRYCEGRRKVLLDHVHEGYENELWEYHESPNV